ncbi:hypothetical protein [Streptomyces sp. ODS28]|uniref:hypothetical protein n=1 Tax=Streptomyces sp. ODS28 TaxID=3136688 RepID=UPI0031EBD9DE
MRIRLHIDEIVLDGPPLDRSQLPALHDAVVAALTGLLAAQPATVTDTARIRTRMPAPAASPTALGGQIAAAVHQGVTR